MLIKSILTVLCCAWCLTAITQKRNAPAFFNFSDSIKAVTLLQDAEQCIAAGLTGCKNKISAALNVAEKINSPYLKAVAYTLYAAAERKYRNSFLIDFDEKAIAYARISGNDSLLIHCLLKYSHDCSIAGKTDLMPEIHKEISGLTNSATHIVLKMRIDFEMGYYQYAVCDYDAARELFSKALVTAHALNDAAWIAVLKRAVYNSEIHGLRPNAQTAFIFDSYNHFKAQNNVDAALCVYITGRAFALNGNVDKACLYYNDAAELFIKNQYLIEAAEANLALAEAYLAAKTHLQKGLTAVSKADQLYKAFKYAPGRIKCLVYYGRLYNAEGKTNEAGRCFQLADSLLKIQPDKFLQYLYMAAIVEKYREKNQLNLIEDTFWQTAALQRQIMPAYMLLRFAIRAGANGLITDEEVKDIKTFTKTGKIDSVTPISKTVTEGFNALTVNDRKLDSSYNAVFNGQLVEVETKYRTKAVQDSLVKITFLNSLKEVKINRQYWIIGFIAVLALLAALLLYLNNRAKKRAQQDAATIALLKEEVDHRVKNIFSNINSIIRNAKSKTSDISGIEIIEQRIAPLQLVFHVLGNKTDGAIALQNYFETIASSLQQSYVNAGQVKVEVEAPVMLEWSKASKLGLIVNELVTNSFKYAFNENHSGLVTIVCRKEVSGKYLLTVSDNGVGLPETAAAKRRGGLTQVKALAQQLDATYEIKTTNGAQFEFWFL